MVKLLLLVLLAPIACHATGAVHVRGQLLCNGHPYVNESVQIWEHNYILADSQMGAVTTDSSGFFSVQGSTEESSPRPYVWIPNYCGTKLVGTRRCTDSVIRIDIPDHYVADGNLPGDTFEIDALELLWNDTTDRHGLGSIWFAEKVCRQERPKRYSNSYLEQSFQDFVEYFEGSPNAR